MLAQHRPQRGLGQLAGCGIEILHPDNRPLRIHDTEIKHGIHSHRHVIPGNDILAGHIQSDDPQVNPHHLLNAGNHNDQPRAFNALEPPEKEHNATLVLRQDLDGRSKNEQ